MEACVKIRCRETSCALGAPAATDSDAVLHTQGRRDRVVPSGPKEQVELAVCDSSLSAMHMPPNRHGRQCASAGAHMDEPDREPDWKERTWLPVETV